MHDQIIHFHKLLLSRRAIVDVPTPRPCIIYRTLLYQPRSYIFLKRAFH